jgi:Thioredoxin
MWMSLSRHWVVVAAVIVASGCSTVVEGAAVVPPGTDPSADVALTEDGFGIQLGKSFAPAQITLYTEPQCTHCADLQFDVGDAIAQYVEDGELVITYRFLTFLDSAPGGNSAKASNAVFVAADSDADISASDLQGFIQELYFELIFTFGDDEPPFADIAEVAGLPSEVVDSIAAGDTGVDVEAMDEDNGERLEKVLPTDAATPTVVDTETEAIVDISEAGWLDQLVESS